MSEYYRLQSAEDNDEKYVNGMNIVDGVRTKRTQLPKRGNERLFIREVIDISVCTREKTDRSD